MQIDVGEVPEDVVLQLEETVSRVVHERWPGLLLEWEQDRYGLWMAWTDGPSVSAVGEVVGPYQEVAYTLQLPGLGVEVTLGRQKLLNVHRDTSTRAEALAAGRVVLLQGAPQLPPGVGERLRAELGPGVPSPGVLHRALDRLDVPGRTLWEWGQRSAVRELLDQSDLHDPSTLLTGLEPTEAAQVETFAALVLDARMVRYDDALLWAAGGGWELTRALQTSTAGR